MSRTYATEDDFEEHLKPEPVPAGAARLLRDASLEVDEMLLTAHYNVDHDGRPTQPHVIAALRDATCAQAEHRHTYGDEIESQEASESISLGPLSFGGRRGGTAPGGVPQHSPKALRYLRLAGLVPGGITDA